MKWKTPEEWELLKKGTNCPMCDDVFLDENKFSFLVEELENSYVRLPKNQFMKGWTIVFFKRHVNELFELTDDELFGFWKEVSLVAKAMQSIYNPVKINYLIFGHHCPHLHCHLLVHSYDDDPSKAVKMDEKEVLLNEDEYKTMIENLRSSIKKLN